MTKSPEQERLERAKASYEAAKVGIFKPGPVAIVDGVFEAPMYAEWPAHLKQDYIWDRIQDDLKSRLWAARNIMRPQVVSLSPVSNEGTIAMDMIKFCRATISFGRDQNFVTQFASVEDMEKFVAIEQAWAAYQKTRKS